MRPKVPREAALTIERFRPPRDKGGEKVSYEFVI